jgi:hypothetical protein
MFDMRARMGFDEMILPVQRRYRASDRRLSLSHDDSRGMSIRFFERLPSRDDISDGRHDLFISPRNISVADRPEG